tara:strand:- start:1024 stop:2319 length:1296 start_codon:yes stop_codon:yes gene_type:complete
MRIGLYGGIANNIYLFAKALAAAGHDILFIRDRTDTYPMSQPFWADCRSSFDLASGKVWTWAEYDELEGELGWVAPDWLLDPVVEIADFQLKTPISMYFRRDMRSMKEVLRNSPYWQNVVKWFQTCDVLLVCGIEGEQMACLSGKPYLIWPHGGDIVLAVGEPDGSTLPSELRQAHVEQQERLAVAFKYATWIGSHDPTAVGGAFCNTIPALAGKPLLHVPIPATRKPRLVKDQRRALRTKLFDELGLKAPQEEIVAFVPSRVDFHWKGHDRLLKAASKCKNLHLVFAGWGKDYEKAIELAKPNGLLERMTFLPSTFSREWLLEIFRTMDFVVDQFTLSTYGTVAVEAMSMSVPVMMYIDVPAFEARGWEAPPVMNCSDVEDIRAWLTEIDSGAIDLDSIGNDQGEWVDRVHGAERVAAILSNIFSGRKVV